MSLTLPSRRVRRRHLGRVAGTAALAILALAGCSTSPASSSSSSGVIAVVAAENFWGSLAEQLGGSHVKVTSIIDNPDADPHDYEPTAADGRDDRRRAAGHHQRRRATTPGPPSSPTPTRPPVGPC